MNMVWRWSLPETVTLSTNHFVPSPLKRVHKSFVYLVTGVFLLLLLPTALTQGFFMDGVIYGAIASNLSEGMGSFWDLQFTETSWASFHEHPPFVFWIQGQFMRLFGNHFYIVKLFNVLMMVFAALAIRSIWNRLVEVQFQRLFWLPILLWTTIHAVYWAAKNNMLETTLSVFALWAVLQMIVAIQTSGSRRFLHFFLGAFLTILCFLSKGPVGLFPLAVPFLYGLAHRKNYGIWKGLFDGAIVVAMVGVMATLLFLLRPEAWDFIVTYYHQQVGASIAGTRNPETRFKIVREVFFQFIPALLATVLFFSIRYRFKKFQFFPVNAMSKGALFCFLIALSASLPMMISPKQMGFYVVPSIPYFALALAFVLSPHLSVIDQHSPSKMWRNVIAGTGGLLTVVALFLMIWNAGTIVRNEDKIVSLQKLENSRHVSGIVFASPKIYSDRELQAYAYWGHGFSFTSDSLVGSTEWKVLQSEEEIPEGYEKVAVEMEALTLVKKK